LVGSGKGVKDYRVTGLKVSEFQGFRVSGFQSFRVSGFQIPTIHKICRRVLPNGEMSEEQRGLFRVSGFQG